MMASLGLLVILGIIYTFILLLRITHSATIFSETKYPCAFIDTVNITGALTQDINGNHTLYFVPGDNANHSSGIIVGGNLSYFHDWIEIPRDLIAVYDFVIENGIRVPVVRHLRACVCKLKPCIRFCCNSGHYYDVINHTCTTDIKDNVIDSLDQNTMVVRGQNGSDYRVSTKKHFNVHNGTPCNQMRPVLSDHKDIIQWTLLENGTIIYKHHHFTKHYCYSPYQMENKTWTWQPLACPIEKLPFLLGVREWTYVICLIIATICMSIIFFMHLICTEICNTFYGVAIKAYSLSIIIGYSLMIHLMLTDPSKMSRITCTIIPCFILLCLLLSFYILTFVSFNFYLNFHGIVLTKLMFWMIFFPIACLAVGWSLFVGFEHYGGKRVFGGETCWFDPRNWSIMVYLNAPIFVACAVSVFFYILTLIQIREHQESTLKRLSNILEENRYKSFWQFFGYTFITWIVFVVSFIINYYRNDRTHINYAVSLIVILHGFGSLYALIGKNQQIQNFLRRLEDGIEEDDEEACESALPMTPLERN